MNDNSNLQSKIDLRTYFLAKLQRPANILECFAGEDRKLYNECYRSDKVISLDFKKIKGVIRVDNKKFIAGEDMNKYSFFDLDAYGSPYELLLNICKKHTSGEPYIIICTDGLSRNLGYGTGSKLIQTIIQNKTKIQIPFLNHHHEYIIKLILKTILNKFNLKCIDAKIIRDESNKMYYFGCMLQKNQDTSLIKT